MPMTEPSAMTAALILQPSFDLSPPLAADASEASELVAPMFHISCASGVLNFKSRPLKFDLSPFCNIRCCNPNEQLKFKRNVATSWATAAVLYAGTFVTFIPLAAAASNAMLLNPVPASHINFIVGGNLPIRAAVMGISLLMMMVASSPNAAMISSSEGWSSSILVVVCVHGEGGKGARVRLKISVCASGCWFMLGYGE